MKRLFVLAMSALVLACGNSAKTEVRRDGNSPPPVPAPPPHKLGPGSDLEFDCPDTDNKHALNLLARWNAKDVVWEVTLEEKDGDGDVIVKNDELTGRPDELETLQMDIFDGSALYARLVQIDRNKAEYMDGKRLLECTFKLAAPVEE